MKGYFNNYHDLQLLIKEKNLDILCIQETLTLSNFNPHTPKQYRGYFHNLSHISNSKQGIGLLIKKNIDHEILNISSNISIIAIQINMIFKFTILNIYIPPSQTFSSQNILHILAQIATPDLIVGDLNSWSPLWGSVCSKNRGKEIENVILSSNLMVLNDGAPLFNP